MEKQTIKQWAWLIAGGILLAWGLCNLQLLSLWIGTGIGLLTPFLLGAAMAFLLNIPIRALERWIFPHPPKEKEKGWRFWSALYKAKRPICLLLALLIVLAIIVVVVFIVVPEMGQTVKIISDQVPRMMERIQQWSASLEEQLPQLAQFFETTEFNWKTINWNDIANTVWNFLQNGATSIVGSTVSVATSVFSGVMNFTLGFVFSLYLLLQKEQLIDQFHRLLNAFLPQKAVERIWEIGSLANRTFSNFFTGQCLEALILGGMFFLSMTIFRMHYALLIAVLVSFTALIPMFGAFIGFFIGVLLILVVDPLEAFWFAILFLVLQNLEGNLIYPKVVGNSVGLPSVWVLAAITIGGSVMGILGMLLAVPLSSVLYQLLRQEVYKRQRSSSQKGGKPKPAAPKKG